MRPSADELEPFLHTLCEAAARETLPRFRAPVAITNKLAEAGDFDPVTLADQNGERAIRDIIGEHFPDHGIVGEEHGITLPNAECRWIIDPIDGTRAFISGLPLWGTLIGFSHEGNLVAGVMDQPFTRERYWTVGDGSFEQVGDNKARAINTSGVTALGQATLMTTSPHLLLGQEDAGYFKLEQAVKMFRYGCDCYAYAMVAAGHIDLVVESGLNIYDIAALVPLIEQAGGVVTDWQGRPLHYSGGAGGKMQVIAAANTALHEQALAVLQG
ncbi:MAG: histidinol-phosphatase [Pseudomonadota bacterium]